MNAALRRSALLCLPSFVLAGCLMSRLENAGDGGQAGDGGTGASGSSGGKDATSGSAGKSMQGGSESGDGGTPDPGGSSSGGTGNTAGDGGTGNTAGDGNTSGSGGSAGSGGSGSDPNAVLESAGCSKVHGLNTGTTKNIIQTSGVKDASCEATYMGVPKCGPWNTPREFYVQLPAGYDSNRAYPLVLQHPTCASNGLQVYPLTAVKDDIIRVGLSAAPVELGHGTNPGIGCFDDREADDSLDFPFYEALMDKLDAELCIDRNRVFASGSSAFLANELACKYAGDPVYPIRGVLANTGGLPTDPAHRPTCSNAPFAGMWIHEVGDVDTPFTGTIDAIDYALKANGCSASSYGQSTFVNYPIGGGQPSDTCKKIENCPDDYPLVICALNGNQHGSHDQVVNPGFATLLTELMAP